VSFLSFQCTVDNIDNPASDHDGTFPLSTSISLSPGLARYLQHPPHDPRKAPLFLLNSVLSMPSYEIAKLLVLKNVKRNSENFASGDI
jgi:hypothetical protein